MPAIENVSITLIGRAVPQDVISCECLTVTAHFNIIGQQIYRRSVSSTIGEWHLLPFGSGHWAWENDKEIKLKRPKIIVLTSSTVLLFIAAAIWRENYRPSGTKKNGQSFWGPYLNNGEMSQFPAGCIQILVRASGTISAEKWPCMAVARMPNRD